MRSLLFNFKENKIKFINDIDVMEELYYFKSKVPSNNELEKFLSNNKENIEVKNYFGLEINNIEKKDIDYLIKKIKINISKIDYKIPLYNEYERNMFIVSRELVYNKVIYEYYRFPSKDLITSLKNRKNELEKELRNIPKLNLDEIIKREFTPDIEYGDKDTNISQSEKNFRKIYLEENKLREFKKLQLMLIFLNYFNIDELENTYLRVFYFYANEVGKNLTVCKKPSFVPIFKHLKPYYTRDELINLALNMELIKISDIENFSKIDQAMQLCNIVKENDISATNIIEHQKYIAINNQIGIIQYYSLQGSYFINKYMREKKQTNYRNILLEETIKSMWKLTLNSPPFDKPYILYRFVGEDSYLKNLRIGDFFKDDGFTSTTRDPFYRSSNYKFGQILIKINIPANKRGVGLSIEFYSNFPEEQEIILPPRSILRLDSKNENTPYYHIDNNFAESILTKYEFSLIGNEDIFLINKIPLPDKYNQIIDFLKLPQLFSFSIFERIRAFTNNYLDPISQFKTKIGDTVYTIIAENYDSTNAYKDFYAITTDIGFSLYSLINNFVTFFIEIGQINDKPIMAVNYYFKCSTINCKERINDYDLIFFLSKVAYYFHIEKVIIYSEYLSCDSTNRIKDDNSSYFFGGNYCVDFYQYLKYKKKRFFNKKDNINTSELRPAFSYYELDRLKKHSPREILSKDDRDEIYQIYIKTYIPNFEDENDNLKDFYIWMVENHCILIKKLNDKIRKIYNLNFPFNKDYYILDPYAFLYNRNIIPDYTAVNEKYSTPVQINEYRLDNTKNNISEAI